MLVVNFNVYRCVIAFLFPPILVVALIFGSVHLITMPVAYAVGMPVSDIDATTGWHIEGQITQSSGDNVGRLARLGDINGDGIDDFAVNTAFKGEVAIIYGKTTGFNEPIKLAELDGTNGFIVYVPPEGRNFARLYRNSVAGIGDFDGDGIEDFLVGVPSEDPIGNPFSLAAKGAAHILLGRRSNWPARFSTADITPATGVTIGGFDKVQLGRRVAGLGDINKDGKADGLVCGSTIASIANVPCYVLYGKAIDAATTYELPTLPASDGFTIYTTATVPLRKIKSATTLGDVNGDSIDDYAFGTTNADYDGVSGDEKAYILFGSTAQRSDPVTLERLSRQDGFSVAGSSFVAKAGDVNNDGVNDILVGHAVIYGNYAGFEEDYEIDSLNEDQGYITTAFGKPFFAGDINGDGIDDFSFGNQEDENDAIGSSGSVYTFFGVNPDDTPVKSIDDLDGTNGFQLDGDALIDYIGADVQALGDVNGDGIDDLGVGLLGGTTPGGRIGIGAVVLFGSTAQRPFYAHYCSKTLFDERFEIHTYVWQDCPNGQPTGQWHLREVRGAILCPRGCGGAPPARGDYKWVLRSDGPITDVKRVGAEPGDSVARTSPANISLEGDVTRGSDYVDGFDFHVASETSFCIEGARSNSVVVGADKRRVVTPTDLIRGAECLPEDEIATISLGRLTTTEADTTLRVKATLSRPQATTITAWFATSSADATAGNDFYGTSQEIQFPPGETVVEIPVVIIDDYIKEDDERFFARIFAVSDPRIAGIKRSITIVDNENSAYSTLSVSRTNAYENAGATDVTITLDRPSRIPVTVKVYTQADTATGGGVDYRGFSRDLVFSPGDTKKTLRVHIVNDSASEPVEEFRIRLTAISGANVAEQTGRVRIIDDDTP